ncbi:MAG TPA: acetyl-CoA carboxylase biotin carboxyl carrier protein [Thermoanaerobaculia bacterium]|nr:acetyl-CoA carboxylase biotin carboxyl carrier protein [Thermoanaerobaculia bacterium]
MTFEQIKELIELVSHNRLQGLELERSGFRLKIDGQSTAPIALAAPMAAAPSAAAPAPAMTGSSAAPAPALTAMSAAASTTPTAPAPAAAATPGGAPAGPPDHIVNSPIVGTFYRAASPDSPPFCEVGSRVKEGQVLCIIEAMKLMNEIESDIDGVITEIYPQNAQAVEFGEPLFAIRPS